MRGIYRVLAFISKEIQAMVVQPQLLLLLVAGPFVVLLVFGLGYRTRGPSLNTLVVQPPPADPSQAIGVYLSSLGPPVNVVGVYSDLDQALGQLSVRKVDLVIAVPPNIREILLAGQNVPLTFYHNAIDPATIGYISAVADGATNRLNRTLLERAVGEQQATAADYEQELRLMQSTLADMRAALQRGDRQQARDLSESLRISSGLVASLWLFSGEPLGDHTTPAIQLAEHARQLSDLLATPDSSSQATEDAIAHLQSDIDNMLLVLEHAQKVPASVLVSPLSWQARGISTYQPGYVAYHSPTVLALLVQHLCVTLAALSLVDERNAGAFELFQVGPTRPGEVLLGKFAAYVLIVGAVAVGLVFLTIYGLRIPLLGDWRWLTAVIAAVMAHSLALGFLISALAKSRSQAIQMSMLALFGSIFFSGFFVPLTDFALPVRLISYSLPVTYGIEQLRQVMLRGEAPSPLFMGALLGWSIVLGLLSVGSLRRIFLAH